MIVGYFTDLSSDNAKAFLNIAASVDNHAFTITSNADVKAKLGVSGDAVVVLKTFDELRNELAISGTLDVEATTDFVIGSCTPLIQTFSDQSSRKIFGSSIKVSPFTLQSLTSFDVHMFNRFTPYSSRMPSRITTSLPWPS